LEHKRQIAVEYYRQLKEAKEAQAKREKQALVREG